MRRLLLGIGCAGVLLVTGCGPSGEVPVDVDENVPAQSEVLQSKLDAFGNDSCFRQPEEQEPHSCERFVTQVDNANGMLERTVERGSEEESARLAAPAERIATHVADYRDNRCDAADSTSGTCTDYLVELAESVDHVRDELDGS